MVWLPAPGPDHLSKQMAKGETPSRTRAKRGWELEASYQGMGELQKEDKDDKVWGSLRQKSDHETFPQRDITLKYKKINLINPSNLAPGRHNPKIYNKVHLD